MNALIRMMMTSMTRALRRRAAEPPLARDGAIHRSVDHTLRMVASRFGYPGSE